jgi:uncharacterized membrane protein
MGVPIWVMAALAAALAVGLIAAVWIGLQRARGDAVSVLVNHGLNNMRIVEIEIVRVMRGAREFTIPELMRRTGASKTLAWCTVQKLMKKGLVRPTDLTRPASGGLGGRGKPSRVYRYVGE